MVVYDSVLTTLLVGVFNPSEKDQFFSWEYYPLVI